MRLALPGSTLVHAGALSLLLVGFNWPNEDDAPAPAPVSVTVVPMATISSNTTEQIASDSTVSAISAGADSAVVAPLQQETLEPISEIGQPVPSPAIEPLNETPAIEAAAAMPLETLVPVEAEVALTELTSSASTAIAVDALLPARAPELAAQHPPSSLQPVVSEELSRAPVPQMASFERQSAPIVHAPRRAEPARAQPQAAGNGGKDAADSVAAAASAPPSSSGAGTGGSADVARYPGQVVGKLRAALRRAGGQRGEVVVRFTVLSSGQVNSLGVARSSGSAAVDDAGLAIVRRAAPFPPIPAAAGRQEWTFDVPLAFGG